MGSKFSVTPFLLGFGRYGSVSPRLSLEDNCGEQMCGVNIV